MFPQVQLSNWYYNDAVHTVALGLGTKTVWLGLAKKKKKKDQVLDYLVLSTQ